MSCRKFLESEGLNSSTVVLKDFQDLLYNKGYGCVNQNSAGQCGKYCENYSKNPEDCQRCLGNQLTCPEASCIGKQVNCNENPDDPCCQTENSGCCPRLNVVLSCQKCMSDSNNDLSKCARVVNVENDHHTRNIVIIVVSVVVAAIVVGLLIYYRKRVFN